MQNEVFTFEFYDGRTALESDLYFFHTDHIGSSNFVADATGAIVSHTEYMPFGEVFVNWVKIGEYFKTTYRFTDELDCETGLYYYVSKTFKTLNVSYGAAQPRPRPDGRRSESRRYYDPAVGRFLTPDPLMDKYPGWSPYNYTLNNPVKYTDPTGMSGESIHKDVDGNIIAEIDDGDNNVYIHKDIGGDGQHIDGQISRLQQKRELNGTGGGGEVDKVASVINKISKFLAEGEDQQQHSGENWYIYGRGAKNGWSINAPKADPNGANKSMDISEIVYPGGGTNGLGKGVLNPILGLDGLNKKVNTAVDRLQKPDSIICDFCSGKRFPLRDSNSHSNIRDTTTNGNATPK